MDAPGDPGARHLWGASTTDFDLAGSREAPGHERNHGHRGERGNPIGPGVRHGETVVSAIVKQPVTVATLSLSRLNLEGDAQADLRAHGGPNKAVYAYPTEHLRPWSEELGLDLHPGAFGENLSIAGAIEQDVFIGDTWRWGDAILQVSQPRSPCFKLAMRLQRPEIIKRMIAGERTGWYLRVLRPGTVQVRGPIEVIARDPNRLSVATAQRAAFGREREAVVLESLARHPALADEWRLRLAGPLARALASSDRPAG